VESTLRHSVAYKLLTVWLQASLGKLLTMCSLQAGSLSPVWRGTGFQALVGCGGWCQLV